MSKYTRALIALTLAAAALPLHAHPLHGGPGDFAAGLAHPFLGLDHVLAAIAVGIWATRLAGHALWAVPLAFVCGIAGGSMIGVAVTDIGVNEPLIAFSVLALGALAVMRQKPPLAVSAAIAAAFAMFHGVAHTAGVADVAWPPLVAGLAIGTALCHAAAIGAAVAVPKAARIAGVAITVAGCYLLAGAI